MYKTVYLGCEMGILNSVTLWQNLELSRSLLQHEQPLGALGIGNITAIDVFKNYIAVGKKTGPAPSSMLRPSGCVSVQ